MKKEYNILLDGKLIGNTLLENADASMGVVFGVINLVDIESAYDFFKLYCVENNITCEDTPEDKFLSTRVIKGMLVVNAEGIAIGESNCSVSGIGNESFEICIEGIPYPFYEEEFPHHVEAYNNLYN